MATAGVAYGGGDPEAEQGDERQVQDRTGGGPEVGGRGEGRVPVRGGEAVAGQDQITAGTARTHVARLLAKLGARDRVQLVITAYQVGLCDS
jgi:hypothetical protein